MLADILVGAGTGALTIVIHALLHTVSTIRAARRRRPRYDASLAAHGGDDDRDRPGALMAAHTAEVFVWSAVDALTGAAPAGSDLVYFAFVNYTTLGYGDIVPATRWRLLGPLTAMNGVLLFGWSTAVIFEVLRKTVLIIPPGGGAA